MDKREACHRLADINEAISEAEDLLRAIEKKILWNDEPGSWYLARKTDLTEKLSRYKQEHDEFISMYSDIIYS